MSDGDHGGGSADTDLRLLESGDFADAIIACRGRVWNVHKCILTSRNNWFRRAFCGSMVEATTGRIMLEEQDPDLIEILLRFIYAKDLDLSKLNGGKQVPALCVRLFRVADFFLHDALKQKATTELKRYLHETPTLHDILPSIRQTPDWVNDVLEAIEEAYEDRSTEPIVDSILSFAYLNTHTVFGTDDGNTLLEGNPEMVAHLLEKHTNGGRVTSDLSTRVTFGLRLVAAVDPIHVRVYDESWTPTPCQLYPVGKRCSSIFKAVEVGTEKLIPSLDWVAPTANEVKRITSNADSDVVLVRVVTSWEAESFIYLRFESIVDAGLYVERFRQANPDIMSTYLANSLLQVRLKTHLRSTVKKVTEMREKVAIID